MIKSLITRHIPTASNAIFKTNSWRCSTLKVVREEDTLTQAQIDDILGNQPTKEVAIGSTTEKQIEERELFYGLISTKNQSFPPCIDPQYVPLLETPNQNIYEAMGLTVQSSFSDYCQGVQTFWRQDELYGDTSPTQVIQADSLQFNSLLKTDSKYLQDLRKGFMVNISIPGSIEVQDPRNFMELRPVEQFRHTPIIPIAESTMREHKQKLEQYHRRQMVFEVSTESIVNFVMMGVAMGICGYMIYLVLQKEEERTVAYTRMKYNRQMGIKQKTPSFQI